LTLLVKIKKNKQRLLELQTRKNNCKYLGVLDRIQAWLVNSPGGPPDLENYRLYETIRFYINNIILFQVWCIELEMGRSLNAAI
jgi:hypothetical protein